MAGTTVEADFTQYALQFTIEAVDAGKALFMDSQVFGRIGVSSYVNNNVTPPTVQFEVNIVYARLAFRQIEKWAQAYPPMMQKVTIGVIDLFEPTE